MLLACRVQELLRCPARALPGGLPPGIVVCSALSGCRCQTLHFLQCFLHLLAILIADFLLALPVLLELPDCFPALRLGLGCRGVILVGSILVERQDSLPEGNGNTRWRPRSFLVPSRGLVVVGVEEAPTIAGLLVSVPRRASRALPQRVLILQVTPVLRQLVEVLGFRVAGLVPPAQLDEPAGVLLGDATEEFRAHCARPRGFHIARLVEKLLLPPADGVVSVRE
eukprot:10416943-Heterocapsa_arctica.AAC.2